MLEEGLHLRGGRRGEGIGGGRWRERKGGDGRKGEEGRGMGVGCGARRPAGTRGPALANDGPANSRPINHIKLTNTENVKTTLT